MNRFILSLCFAAFSITNVAAAVISIAPPADGAAEIGARIRWGQTGFEASILDGGSPSGQPNLNPGGTPVWQLNQDYKFQVLFDGTTGGLTLSVDFDRNDSFASNETISKSAFAAPGLTSYLGQAFRYIRIIGNEGGSTARSTVSNLSINGASQTSISPNGGLVTNWYADAAPLSTIQIDGVIRFTTAGTSQERPSWSIEFANPTAPIPEPSMVSLLGLGLGGLIALRRKRQAKQAWK